jgi:peptidylprolyl isomerase domain and WD repeat-containing protein 1
VKHYKAHLGVIVAIAVSFDGRYFATAGGDKGLKIFDVLSFDMINMIKTEFLPLALCWTFQKDSSMSLICVSDKESCKIQFYDGRGSNQVLFTIDTIHSVPVHLIAYNPIDDVVVSIDTGGMLEYWTPRLGAELGYQVDRGVLEWEYKTDTDLYEFKKVTFHLCNLLETISTSIHGVFAKLSSICYFWI